LSHRQVRCGLAVLGSGHRWGPRGLAAWASPARTRGIAPRSPVDYRGGPGGSTAFSAVAAAARGLLSGPRRAHKGMYNP
jgi:hypothetical protein